MNFIIVPSQVTEWGKNCFHRNEESIVIVLNLNWQQWRVSWEKEESK